MGNFSRDPIMRLNDSMSKHYIGVRLQQGVPLLDADWNEMEDLRRQEVEDLGLWMIGNGVPAGNDGFRIDPIAGGGINTIVLVAQSTGIGSSSIQVDLDKSSAAAMLGFVKKNCAQKRFGDSPAQLTGNTTEPFTLTNGSTLVVQVDDHPAETITFHTPTPTTAAQVAAAIIGNHVTARAGAGNDFIIKGGDGTTTNAGRILIDGQMALNENDLKYTDQVLYKNAGLATSWGVDPVVELVTPTADESCVVYLDVWHREVDSHEDSDLVDQRIGVETANRIRCEWVVRVARKIDYPVVLADKPAGHSYLKLAELNRVSGKRSIEGQMIDDVRDTDLSLRREIAYRKDDSVLVNSDTFLSMLIETRNNVRDFIQYLATKFVLPSSAYVAGEVVGMDALSVIANVADHGISLLFTKSLATKDAFAFFEQLLDVETRFVNIWKTAVLPIVTASGKIYETAYKATILNIESFLIGPAPTGFVSLTAALHDQRNLNEAVRTQRQINSAVGEEIGRPTGFLLITYLGSTATVIAQIQPIDLCYQVSGSVTPEDNIDVEITIDSSWQTTLLNSDGSLPFRLHLGPGSDKDKFLVRVLPPNIAGASTQISLRVSAYSNHNGLYYFSTQKTLVVGAAPPLSEEDYSIAIATTNVSSVNGIFQVPVGLSSANVTFRFYNNKNSVVTINLEYDPQTSLTWGITKGPFAVTGQLVNALASRDFLFHFVPPGTAGQSLAFKFRALNQADNTLLAEIQISFIST
jgi:hypothetical protein